MQKFTSLGAVIVLFLSSFSAAIAQTYLHNSTAETTCGGTYYDSGGPAGNYSNQSGSTIYKTFTSANGNRLKFSFQQFITEGAGLDFLTVFDGPDNTYPVLGVYQGNLGTFSLEGSGASLTFGFRSSASNAYAGWAATIECTTAPIPVYNMSTGSTTTCSGVFYDNGGGNADYPNFDERTQTFCSSNGQKMVATFNPLETSLGSSDTLWAYDGNATTSPLLGIYTINSTLETLTSSGTCLTFRFKSDGTVNERGWQAFMSCTAATPNPVTYVQSSGVRATCNGIFTDDGGESGNYSNLSGGTKTQTFTSYNGNRLKFNFQQFVTETGVDYLTVYDGPTSAYTKIGTYSGNLSNFSVEGTGSSLTFVFYSNFQNAYTGWRGTFECTTPVLPVYKMSSGTVTTCEGMFYDNSGANANYPNFENRTQTFCSSNGQRMVATFNPLDTDFGAGDTLWAYDGSSTAAALLGIYTAGSTIEKLTSSGTCLTFRFKSDGTGTARGWAAMLSCSAIAPTAVTYVMSSGQRYTCNGVFTDDGGSSGNYANLSGGNRVQTFTSYNGNRLKINFQQFVTESGTDYMTIYDGPTTAYPVIGTYSGNRGPFSVEGTGSSLTFLFYSNFQNAYEGWAGTFECTTPVLPVYNMSSGTTNTCSGMFYDVGGANANYYNFENRTQTFCSDNGEHVVATFNPIETAFASGDTLFVYDGTSTASPLLGIYMVSSTIEKLTSSGTCLTFRFKSDGSGTARGWAAMLSCTASAPPPVTYAMSSGQRYTCNGVFTDDGGSTGNYANLSGGTRTQTFTSYNGNRLKINFQQFVTESGTDYMTIYDGPSTAYPVIGTYSGNRGPFSVEGSGSSLTFSFYSNFSTAYEGWVGTFECTTPVLPVYNMSSGTTNTCSGMFYDVGGANANYYNFENRTQTFCSNNGERMEMTFNPLATNFASGDTLFVYDGTSTSSPMLGIYMVSSTIEKLTSSGSCLTFRFKSDGSGTASGWAARLACTPNAPQPVVYVQSSGRRYTCNGVFTDDGGSTGNYANLSGGTRTQIFTSYNGNRLKINFQQFVTESGTDYMTIYDGPSTAYPVIGTYSGNRGPFSVEGTGSSLTFSFYSSFSTAYEGWIGTFECTTPVLPVYNMSSGTVNTCKGVFYDVGGADASYYNFENRTQTFCSDNGQRVVIKFNKNETSLTTGDTLFAYDGTSVSAPLLGVYVSGSTMETLTASGTCLTFRFKTDGNAVARGWAGEITCTSVAPDPVAYNMSSGRRYTCNGVFTDDGGSTGNYANLSGGTRTQIFTSYNGNRLKINFQQFVTESGTDYMTIYDGPSTAYPVIGTYSGNRGPFSVEGTGSSLTFSFYSSFSTTYEGWVGTFECTTTPLPVYTMSNNPVSVCEGVWFDDGGIGNYLAGKNYTQTFCSPNSNRLVFNFNQNQFAINSTDSLWVYDGNSASAPLLATITRNAPLEPIISTGTCLTFRFQSITNSNGLGWSANFYCTENPPQPEVFVMRNGVRVACAGLFTDDGGLNNNYADGQNKTYTFRSSTAGAKVQFNFEQFVTQSGSDLLRIYDGPNTAATLIGTYSGSNGPGVVTSSGSALTFNFTSSASTNNVGWRASMACVATVPLVGTLTGAPYCAGAGINIPFTSPVQSGGNVFTAQLSDANGTFSNPVTLGTLTGTGSGTINANLPAGLSTSGNYRIRILGSNPATSGNGSAPFTILAIPGQPSGIAGQTSVCAGTPNISYTASAVTGATGYTWTVPPGFTIVSGQGSQTVVVNAGIASGALSVVATNGCGTGSAATVTVSVNPATTPTVSVSSSAAGNPVCAGSVVTFNGTVSAGSNANLQWILNGEEVSGANGNSFQINNIASNASVTLRVNTTTGCFNPTMVTSQAISVTVVPSVQVSASISSSAAANTVCAGAQVTFTSSAQNPGSNPVYAWRVNGNVVPGQTGSSFSTSTLVNGDLVSLSLTSSAQCATPAPFISNSLEMVVTPSVAPTVGITSSTGGNQVCAGQQLVLTANASNGGTSPAFQWKLNGGDIAGATSASYTTPAGLTGTNNYTVQLVSDAMCAIPPSVISGVFTVNAVSAVTPSVSVTSSATGTQCVGTSLTFTAVPVNGGASPGFQWRINGNTVSGQTGSVFTTSTLQNGDVVSVQITSNDPCASPLTAVSSGTPVALVSSIVPTVSVISSVPANTICQGESITFTASPTNGGSTPQYQWTVNGAVQTGETGTTFTTSSLANGAQVRVRLTSSFSCANPGQTTSSPVTILVNAPVTPTISVNGPAGNSICEGTTTTLSANITNGGTAPLYQWFAGGNAITGATEPTYTTPANLTGTASYTVQITSNAACVSPAVATSANYVLSITPGVTPSVSVASSVAGNTICNGQSITFTATPSNGGTNPQYQWLVNGTEVTGQTGVSFTTTTLQNGNTVSVRLASNAACATPNPVAAPNQNITVTPNSPASVSVTSNAQGNTICQGQNVTFTANPVNGGTNPTYQWILNGTDQAGQTSVTFQTSTLQSSDQVSVRITSNSACANPAVGTSAPVSLTVQPTVVPTVALSTQPSGVTFCAGTQIVFTANPGNGGSAPQYEWRVNNNLVPNITGATFAFTLNQASTVTATLISNAACANPTSVTSPGVALAITPPPVVTAQADTAVCEATGAFTLTGSPAGGTWSGSGVSSAGVFSPGTVGNYRLFYLFSDGNCTGKDSVNVQVKARPTVTVPAVNPVCVSAAPIQVSGTPGGGTWSGTGVTSGGLFNPATAGVGQQVLVYTATANGCSASKPLIVAVTPAPSVDIGGNETVCFSTQEVQMVAIPAGGTWSGEGVDADGTFTPGFVIPGNTVTLTYSYTENGCTVLKTKQVTVSFNPATVSAGADQTVCVSDPAFVLTGFVGSGGTWSGTGVSATGVFNPTTSGTGTFTLTYTVTFTQSPGCQGADSKVVTVIPSPQAPAASGDTICKTGIGLLTANGVAASFRWYTTATGGLPIAGQTAPTLTTPVLSATTTYYVSQVAGSCESPRAAVTAFVNQFDNAAFTIQAGLPVVLNATPANGQQYQWMLNGTAIPGAVSASYQPVQTGDYSVLIALDGCKDTSATQFVLIVSVTGLQDVVEWALYPNPANQEVFIEGAGIEEVRLLDMLGRPTGVQARGGMKEVLQLPLGQLPAGVYWLEMKSNSRLERKKVVVRR